MEQRDCHRFKGGDGQLPLAGVSETANIADRVLRLMSVVQARVPGSCDRAERPAAERRSASQRGRKVDGDHGQQPLLRFMGCMATEPGTDRPAAGEDSALPSPGWHTARRIGCGREGHDGLILIWPDSRVSAP